MLYLTVWLIALVVPDTIGTVLVFGYDLDLLMILAIRPRIVVNE